MIEEGYAWPGTMAVASDSHSYVLFISNLLPKASLK